MRYGTDLMRQADVLALFSEDTPQITRTYLSEQHKQAGEYLIGLMRRAGMTAGFDALGNIVGRYEAADPNAPVVMTGSHQDSVRNAGKYDGLFGIITAIACVKDLHARGIRLPYTLEVVGFGEPATDEVSSPQEVLRQSEPVAQSTARQEMPPTPS